MSSEGENPWTLCFQSWASTRCFTEFSSLWFTATQWLGNICFKTFQALINLPSSNGYSLLAIYNCIFVACCLKPLFKGQLWLRFGCSCGPGVGRGEVFLFLHMCSASPSSLLKGCVSTPAQEQRFCPSSATGQSMISNSL